MTYLPNGNINSRNDLAGATAAWTYSATKKHFATQIGASDAAHSYTPDANGNAATRFGFTNDWTSYNYPAVLRGAGESASFSYGPFRQRFKQVYTQGSATETTMYVGGLLEVVSNGTTVDWRHYIPVNGQVVAMASRLNTGTNATRYLLNDHLGSVARILDSAAGTVVSESFAPFGARRNAATWSGPPSAGDVTIINSISRSGFTGQVAVGSVAFSLTHLNGRVLDNLSGRFLSADPYVFGADLTQGWNRYSYVSSNPLSYVDPSGFKQQNCTTSSITFPGLPGNGGSVADGGTSGVTITSTQCPDAPDPSQPPSPTLDTPRVIAQQGQVKFQGNLEGVAAEMTPQTTQQRSAWQKFKSDLEDWWCKNWPGNCTLGAFLAPFGPAAGAEGEGLAVIGSIRVLSNGSVRALKAADFGSKASLKALEGTFAVQGRLATVSVRNLEGNLGVSGWDALNALKATARAAGATSLRIEGTIGNPAVLRVLERLLGPATRGVAGGAQDIWVLGL